MPTRLRIKDAFCYDPNVKDTLIRLAIWCPNTKWNETSNVERSKYPNPYPTFAFPADPSVSTSVKTCNEWSIGPNEG